MGNALFEVVRYREYKPTDRSVNKNFEMLDVLCAAVFGA
jgi:hypothetical protein